MRRAWIFWTPRGPECCGLVVYAETRGQARRQGGAEMSMDFDETLDCRVLPIAKAVESLFAQVEAWREAAYSGKRLLEYGSTGEFSTEATRRLTDGYDSTWKKARALDSETGPAK